jgi:hypothetical protein
VIACVAEAGHPSNWVILQVDAPDDTRICETRVFSPADPNDYHGVVVAWNADGTRRWTVPLRGEVQQIRVDGDRLTWFGDGGISHRSLATGALLGRVAIDGWVDRVVEVGGVTVAHVGDRVVGVDLRQDTPRVLWSAYQYPNLVVSPWQVCGDRVYVAHAVVVSGHRTVDPVSRLEIWSVDPRKGVVGTVPAGGHRGFFDAVRVDLVCADAGALATDVRWIVYE